MGDAEQVVTIGGNGYDSKQDAADEFRDELLDKYNGIYTGVDRCARPGADFTVETYSGYVFDADFYEIYNKYPFNTQAVTPQNDETMKLYFKVEVN